MSHRRLFQPSPHSVRDARLFVESALHDDGVHSLHLLDLAMLAVSELATNAVQHAVTPYEVTVDTSHALRIEVLDGSPVSPRLRAVNPEAERGRGVAIVDSTSDRWGVWHADDGKHVWWEVDLTAL